MRPSRRKVKEVEPAAGVLLPMISYAQNYEDVLARRALGDPPKGFFVDVGAAESIDILIRSRSSSCSEPLRGG